MENTGLTRKGIWPRYVCRSFRDRQAAHFPLSPLAFFFGLVWFHSVLSDGGVYVGHCGVLYVHVCWCGPPPPSLGAACGGGQVSATRWYARHQEEPTQLSWRFILCNLFRFYTNEFRFFFVLCRCRGIFVLLSLSKQGMRACIHAFFSVFEGCTGFWLYPKAGRVRISSLAC